ncbi:30S ribosomal protein S14 [Candidatus Methanoliparum sp. LAM-1]|uniref:30S ribosomal protein S14 n=1 Tax=Candidatus Methanoliparum sp. LAM-1 TaxID=2874846 RepID=UPI001E292DDC|nr:30S ribosomal protein S14 [Candidatus Methanoliparum sp. LAM-1]
MKSSNKHSGKVFGRGANRCYRCGRRQGLIRRYNMYLCRQCFRELAGELGFKKYW